MFQLQQQQHRPKEQQGQEQEEYSPLILVPDESSQLALPMQFPDIWLRDNCLCPECYLHQTRSRLPQLWQHLDTKRIQVRHLNVEQKEEILYIEWNDGHRSEFPFDWLRERDFSFANRTQYLKNFYRPEPRHWSGREFASIQKEFLYEDLISHDDVLHQWLYQLAVYGMALIKEAPLEFDVVRHLCNRVGFMRRTTYGEEFSVRAQPGASNYAYLAAPLPLHTDMPYFEYKPGVTLLHTLEQSDSPGGVNLLTDAFFVADILKQQYPEQFRILTETPVDWADIGNDNDLEFHNIWRSPVINVDSDGRYVRINHSIPQRDSHFNVHPEQVRPWYEAMALFVRLAHEQAYEFKTKPGDVLTFNNIRLVHGRTGYSDTEQNVRHIVGGFLDWDIVYSRWRILQHSKSAMK